MALFSFLSYFLILIFIGCLAYYKNRSTEHSLMSSRSVSFWVTAISAHASDMSSWLFMAFPAAIFIGGLSEIWIGVGLFLGMFCNWHFIAPKLRLETEKYKTFTISGYFSHKYPQSKFFILILCAMISLFFYTIYVAGNFVALGLLFETSLAIDKNIGVFIALAVVLIYTMLGGFVAVAWTDFFQGIFLLLVILFVPTYIYFNMPVNMESFIHKIPNQELEIFSKDQGVKKVLLLIFSMGLGYFGQLHILNKFMGIKDPKNMKKSKYLGLSWQFLALLAAVAVGLLSNVYFDKSPENNELIFLYMVRDSFHPFIAGFIACAVLAATISTIDSQILVLIGVLTEDFYQRICRPKASSKELKLFSRLAIVFSLLFSVGITFYINTVSIFSIVMYAWSGLGASFGPLLLYSLYSKERIDSVYAILAIIGGGLISAIWPLLQSSLTWGQDMSSLIPGFIFGCLILQCGSYRAHKKYCV